jgi:hypothetical protein
VVSEPPSSVVVLPHFADPQLLDVAFPHLLDLHSDFDPLLDPSPSYLPVPFARLTFSIVALS